MNVRWIQRAVAQTALVSAVLFGASRPVLAQTPVRVKLPGTAFSVTTGGKAAVEDVGGGERKFRATDTTVTLRGLVQLPPPSVADPRLQRVVVRFRTNRQGASLRSVELRNGSGSGAVFHIETMLSGDFTSREMTQPKAVANAWVIEPTSVGAQSNLRLEVGFPGGFEGARPEEIVLASVELEFPRKPLKLADTVVHSSTAIGSVHALTPGATPASALVPSSNGVIYIRTANDDLLWYRHDGRTDGTFRWAAAEGKKVGSGWAFKQVFSGGNGVIYAITDAGDLLWYRHDGHADGTFRWAAADGKKIASGWSFKQVFSGGDGVIYVIDAHNELRWYRHDGRTDGTARWAPSSGRAISTDWKFEQVFAANDGIIYAINARHEVLWYRHDGHLDGADRWAPGSGQRIASNWDLKQVFSDGSGVIYGVSAANDLMWHRHDGSADGTSRWTALDGKEVGNGWSAKEIFSGGMPGP